MLCYVSQMMWIIIDHSFSEFWYFFWLLAWNCCNLGGREETFSGLYLPLPLAWRPHTIPHQLVCGLTQSSSPSQSTEAGSNGDRWGGWQWKWWMSLVECECEILLSTPVKWMIGEAWWNPTDKRKIVSGLGKDQFQMRYSTNRLWDYHLGYMRRLHHSLTHFVTIRKEIIFVHWQYSTSFMKCLRLLG